MDIYTKDQRLEIMPLITSKANGNKATAISFEMREVSCVWWWKNGIDMFELADESYAVQNAHEYLKKLGPRLSPQMMRLVSQNGLMNILSWCERTYRET